MTNLEILSSNHDVNPWVSNPNSETTKSSLFGKSSMFELSRFKFRGDDIK
ncbi:MAG TPA: hypothetical protein VLR54_00515 [Methanobacteriaceae archaeon]|nr:hypothetical protein [Methanobacteriaceae archaeon]